MADDAYVVELAGAVAGDLGGRVGVVPRILLRKLVGTSWTGSTGTRTSTRAATTG